MNVSQNLLLIVCNPSLFFFHNISKCKDKLVSVKGRCENIYFQPTKFSGDFKARKWKVIFFNCCGGQQDAPADWIPAWSSFGYFGLK
jgi:hypothetical protein